MSLARRISCAFLATLAFAVSGCSADDGSADGTDAQSTHVFAAPEEGAYPVTIDHALGATTITEQPERVVVIGWAGPDLAVALGTVPVAQGPAAGIEDDYYPWFREAVDELGADLPVTEPSLERGEVDIEFVLSQNPDLILAINSGISEVEYERLSEIAATVAYPTGPWATSIPEHVTMMGAALGRPDGARQIERELDETLATTAQGLPQLQGLTYLQASLPGDDGSVVVFSSVDQRSKTLEALGLQPLPEVGEILESSGQTSSFAIGLEELRALQPDVLVVVATDEEWDAALAAHPVFASWAPVAEGNVARISDLNVGLAFATSTPLGLAWGIEDIGNILADAVG